MSRPTAMSRPLAVLAAFLALNALPARADAPSLRDLTIEQDTAAQAGPARPGPLQVSLTPDRADATYAVGEGPRLQVAVSEDAYVSVISVGPAGQVTQLFPNLAQPDNRVAAGRPLEIGGPGSGARLTVTGPVGVELIKVVATSRPAALAPEAQLQGRGPFRTMSGGVSTYIRNLEVVAEQAERDQGQVAVLNVTLRTMPARFGAAPGRPAARLQAPGEE